ncbi:MAG: hypothetical protein MZV65_43900 [Chromatiales bacterium]|nr:hypothetical protein [Chromatiales bacterium]
MALPRRNSTAGPWVARLAGAGGRADVAPRCRWWSRTDAAMHFRRWVPRAPMVADRHGIPHPADGGGSRSRRSCCVPLNAFDAAGYRLGYGGGYFDRTLAGADAATIAIGVGFELAAGRQRC